MKDYKIHREIDDGKTKTITIGIYELEVSTERERTERGWEMITRPRRTKFLGERTLNVSGKSEKEMKRLCSLELQ